MNNLVGQTLGQFQIIQELGRGGMAIVYKAYQPTLQRYVALKVLPAQFAHDEGFVKRFRQEAIAAARLQHPNIVTIYDVGQIGDIQFIVMELLEGQSLAKLVQSGALPPARVAGLIGQIASALDYAHKQGFVHRDIKPANIMVDASDHATLTDFGIARALGSARLTQTGVMVGTPQYMAPEQVRGLPVDHRADVYALGIVCYEMLTGQAPFTGDTATVLYKQAHETPPPISQLAPRTPPATAAAVARALAKHPAERFQSAGEFAAALSASVALAAMPSHQPARPPTLRAEPQGKAPLLPTAAMRPSAGKGGWPAWLGWAMGAGALALACLVISAAIALLSPGASKATPTPLVAIAGNTLITPTATPKVVVVTATSGETATATETPVKEATVEPTASATPTKTPRPPTTTPTPGCPPVSGPFAAIWQSAQSKLGCATNEAHGTWIAEEFFERGVMYWRQDQDKYVIAIYNSGSWGTYLGDWKEGEPEFTCGQAASPPTPKRGFGRAWCNYPEIRNGLGNATNAEVGFNGTVQDFERGLILRTDDGTTYVLYSGDGWEKR